MTVWYWIRVDKCAMIKAQKNCRPQEIKFLQLRCIAQSHYRARLLCVGMVGLEPTKPWQVVRLGAGCVFQFRHIPK